MASGLIESDKLYLFLLSDDSRTDDNEYLESLKTATELIHCTKEQMCKLSICFDIKRYLSFKNIENRLLFIIKL